MEFGSVQPPEVQDTTPPALLGDIKVTSSVPPPPCSLFKPILLHPSVPASGSREHQMPEKCREKREGKETIKTHHCWQLPHRWFVSGPGVKKSSCPQDLSVPHPVCKSMEHIRGPWELFKRQNNPRWTNILLGQAVGGPSQGCPFPAQGHPWLRWPPQQHPLITPLKMKLLARASIPIKCYHCRAKQTAFTSALISSPSQHRNPGALPVTFQQPKLLKQNSIPTPFFYPHGEKNTQFIRPEIHNPIVFMEKNASWCLPFDI